MKLTRKQVIKQYNNGRRDFSGANLNYADLRNADLGGTDLRWANLQGVNNIRLKNGKTSLMTRFMRWMRGR